MKKLKTAIIFQFLTLAICGTVFSQQQKIKNNIIKNVPVIELSGNGYNRGLQHGKILKTEIDIAFKKWKTSLESFTQQNADTLISKFYQSTNFVPAIMRWTPAVYDEIKGLAESSGQAFIDVYCYQMMDEFWVYMDKMEHAEIHHCSGIGVAASGSHAAYIAQNLDGPGFMNGSQILIHIKAYKNEPEQYLLSGAGLVAMNGVNSNGIGVTVNTLMDLSASSDGLPVACVVRGILLKKDKQSALDFLQTVKHASGQNYILGVVDSVFDFEASANKVVRFIPVANNSSLVYHTNHAVSNSDLKPWYKGSVFNNSIIRFASLKTRLDITDSKFSDNSIKKVLRSKDNEKYPVCVTYKSDGQGSTFSSIIFTLGKNPTVQITNGSPDQAEYILHKFTKGK